LLLASSSFKVGEQKYQILNSKHKRTKRTYIKELGGGGGGGGGGSAS